MAFSIYNKLNKPIYIDWKKSNYINNSNKFDYWADEVQSNTTSRSKSRLYLYTGAFMPFSSSYGNSKSSTTTTKSERVDFLPPKSFLHSSKYYITSEDFDDWGSVYEKREEARHDNPKKKTTVIAKHFTYENSPVIFRNFLTFSTKEDFSTEFYVDNEFYIEDIQEMDNRHFSIDTLINMVNRKKFFYKKGTSFYVN